MSCMSPAQGGALHMHFFYMLSFGCSFKQAKTKRNINRPELRALAAVGFTGRSSAPCL
uniref:Uncharacterized protein n=1 Tax=Anguilla anguilla TaxID=7936 RepID=A0A0E9REA2_ANGAN